MGLKSSFELSRLQADIKMRALEIDLVKDES
jgi:hypothetical protein